AEFPSMPQAAIATGMADFIAPIARLAERVAEVARSKEAVQSLDMGGAANELRRIISLLRSRIGHDFSAYKRATVMRRVQRRMQVCRKLTLADYADHLLTTPEEAQNLFSDLLISVTMFFRDEAAFRDLATQVIKPLLETAVEDGQDGLRVWVVGCATGEEAYSVAMLIFEQLAEQKAVVPFQIFATDLDDGALTTAREGRYPRTIEADVSEERLARFFVDEGQHYRVRKELRDSVIFAKHSILREPPFMRLDLITCRNLLIYLERAVQAQVCSIFHYSLRPGRYLFLGSAETTDVAAELFAPVDRQARLYMARPQVASSLPILPQFAAPELSANSGRPAQPNIDRSSMPGVLHIDALESTAPPSALVDYAQMVLHLSPSVGRFILNSAGPLSRELPAVVRPELRLDLRLALLRALDQGKPTTTLPTVVAFEQEWRRVTMHVMPVADPDSATSRALVYFLDGGSVAPRETDEAALEASADDVHRLHAELKAAHEALLASRSGHDVSIQELRAANEEFQSINEEYRSTAEELETSKEELQSIKGKWNAMEAKRTAITGPMNKALTAINALFKAPMESLKQAETVIKNAMLTYSNEQDRLAAIARREAEAKAAAERNRLAEEARQVELAAAAERRRLAEAETARVAAETAERERLEAEAKAAAASGDAAKVAALEQQVGTLLEQGEMAAQQTRQQVEEIDQSATMESAALRM
ncbi:MAG: hypothetical protein EOP21_03985, partial [Hyphomicrobiales bacterium]